MGWPRAKKPKSSGNGQNTGISGAQHAVADTGQATASAEPAINEEMAPINEEIVNPEASETRVISGTVVPGDDSGGTEHGEAGPVGYDETAGIVYEARPQGFEALGLDGPAHEDAPGGAAAAATPSSGPAAGASAPDEPPTLEQTAVVDHPSPPNGESADSGPRQPSGRALFNQTMASAPQPVESERNRRDNPFGRISGLLLGQRGSGAAPGDGEPPLTRFRDLPLDEKLRIWRLRALIVIVVGILFTIIASWQVGITLAIIAGIADTIYRSRTVETHHATPAGAVDRATLKAQKATIKQLAGMERSGYLALHKRPIPGSEEVIDHLVVGPTGVYAIDSEKWNKDLPVRTSSQKQLWLGPESKKDRLKHAHWEAGKASERLSEKLGTEVTVQPALAIYGPKISWDVVAVRGVDVFSGNRLKKYLKRRARRKGLPRLSEEQIRKIYEAASDVLPLEWQNTATPVG
ncbi:MAG: NERD domain-containing protein [Nocardiopsaceae bacterium]|nr:NERD domain-containing protein [Nocardiopsaceae bacterium]